MADEIYVSALKKGSLLSIIEITLSIRVVT
jgi:hypothetical protein